MAQMDAAEKIRRADIAHLTVIKYPDPRLTEICMPVEQVDDDVRALTEAMRTVMFAVRGVGLAAPQVGVTVRLFVATPTMDRADTRVLINPEIISAQGTQQEEEGCLSLPGIACKVKRSRVVTVRAMGLDGEVFEETVEDLAARIYQHEIDHLDGKLLVARMGTVARLTNRRTLKDLEKQFAGVLAGIFRKRQEPLGS